MQRRDFIRCGALWLPAAGFVRPLIAQNVAVRRRAASGGGGGGIALVSNQTAHGVNGATTSAIDTTGATLLVLAVAAYTSGPADSVSDSKSNTWTALTEYSHSSGFARIRLYYVANPTVGSGHTFSNSGSGNYTAIAVAAFSGVATTSPLDAGSDVGANNVAASAVSPGHPGSITVTDGHLAISAETWAYANPTTLFSIDSGYTITDQYHSSSVTEGVGLAYKVATSTGALNPGWTPDQTGGGAFCAASFTP